MPVTLRRKRNPLRFDPSRTSLLRRQFTADILRRFARVRAAVWDLVVKQDAFDLKEPVPPTILYDPDQPRVPAGSSEGGQWVKEAEAILSKVPEQFRSGLVVRVMKTGRGSMRVGKEIRLEPALFKAGKKALTHDIYHEVGHYISSRLTKASREALEEHAAKVKTPVTEKYRRYVEEQGMAGIFSASLDRKLSDEQMAEMFRQHLQEGKHTSIVRKIKMAPEAPSGEAVSAGAKKGMRVSRLWGGELERGVIEKVNIHKPTGKVSIRLKGDKKWYPGDWWTIDVANFDPNQPRDEWGRWTDEGASVSVGTPMTKEDTNTFFGKKLGPSARRILKMRPGASYEYVNKAIERIQKYTDATFRRINPALRRGEMTDEIKGTIEALSLLKPVKPGTVVYRGYQLTGVDRSIYKAGAVIADKAIVSTSTTWMTADRFSHGPDARIVMELKDTRGLGREVPYALGHKDTAENEVVYPPGTRIKLTKVTRKGDNLFAEGEIL